MANDNVKGVTEMGKAIYPHLNKPDVRFQKEGLFKVTLELTPEHAEKLIKQIDDGVKQAIKESGSKSIKTANKPYKKTEDNTYTFNFKCKASGVTKTGQAWTQKPKVFDTKGHPIPKDILVWGGTDMKVAYEIIPYANNLLGAGVSLRLKAVQVVNLVSGNGASAAKADEIGRLGTSDAVADLAILGTTDVVSDLNTLANSTTVTNMNLLGTSDCVADMALLGLSGVISDMDDLATSANITAMGLLGNSTTVANMGLLGVSGVITNMGLLGTSTVLADMALLGTSDCVADMAQLASADFISDLNTLASSSIVTDMDLLGTSANVTNMATLGASGVVANIATTAGSISNVNNVGGAITNINTVATNLAAVNSFANTYRIASSAPTSSLDVGDLYFDTSANELKVYKSSGWAAAGSTVNGTSQRYKYVATSNQTTFSGADANSATLAYDSGFIDVYLNGVHLDPSDFTASSGTSVVLGSGAATGDILYIVAFGTFAVAAMNADNLNSGTIPVGRYGATVVQNTWESKSADFTAAAGKSYFCDTTSNAIDVTLPSGTIGDEIRFLDVSGTFDTNDLTILYGSSKIQGASANLDVSTERAGFALIYYNATQGWLLKDK